MGLELSIDLFYMFPDAINKTWAIHSAAIQHCMTTCIHGQNNERLNKERLTSGSLIHLRLDMLYEQSTADTILTTTEIIPH